MIGSQFVFHVDPRNKDTRDELAIQVAFRRAIIMTAPEVMLVGVPNAGKRSQWESRQRSKEGMVPGFPDLIALHRGMACFLEFKTGSGSLSDNQIDTLNALARQGFPVGVFRSELTALSWLRGNMPSAFRIAA